jgi:CarD family transcriptional regulator
MAKGVFGIFMRMKKGTTSKNATKFKDKEQVVYPIQGVGQVINIYKRKFEGETKLYYEIYFEVSDMTIHMPVDKAEDQGIRPIVSKRQADAALNLIAEEFEPVPADWKLRYQMNLDLLKQGSIKDIATVVRALYHRSKVKELPILERKLFDNALNLLVDEVSFSLNKSKIEVEELVFERLESEPKKPAKAARAPRSGAAAKSSSSAARKPAATRRTASSVRSTTAEKSTSSTTRKGTKKS